MSTFSKKVGNGQARKDDPQSSKDRDANPSLTGKIERQKELIRNAPPASKPETRIETTERIWNGMTPEQRAQYPVKPWSGLHEDLARGPYLKVLKDGDRVRLQIPVKGQHPEIDRATANLEQRIQSFESVGIKNLSSKGRERYEQDKAQRAKVIAQGSDATK
jgi:hypothetical protein